MESNQSSTHFTTASSGKVTKHSLETCNRFDSVTFEIIDSTIPYIVNVALNVPMALVAALANILVFSAICKSTTLHLPSKLLICGLVLTDLGVALVAQPLFVAFLVAKVRDIPGILCICETATVIISHALACVSVMTMTAISLDRYAALYFHFRYNDIVTTARVCVVLVVIWLLAGFLASMWVWSLILNITLPIVTFSVCFLVMSVAYIKIYRGLGKHQGHQTRVQGQVQTPQPARTAPNLARYRKSAMSMLWIYGLFMLCYFPFACVQCAVQFVELTALVQCIREFTATIIHLNACLNPCVYCLRLPEIRAIVLRTLRKPCRQ